jgi:hypothetical protein
MRKSKFERGGGGTIMHEFLKMTSPSVLVAIEHRGMQKKNLPSALLTASLLVTVTPGKSERESQN